MSDTPHRLVDCQRWYGEVDGQRIYNKHRDVLYKIFTNPTEIRAIEKKPVCLHCGSEKIGMLNERP